MIKRFDQYVNEEFNLDDAGNTKAFASLAKTFITGEDEEYELTVNEPFTITVDKIDKAKFGFLLNKYRVKFTAKEL